jgi:hypothetical protein
MNPDNPGNPEIDAGVPPLRHPDAPPSPPPPSPPPDKSARDSTRTRYEASLDIDYSVRFHGLSLRFWRTVEGILAFGSLASTMGLVTVLTQGWTGWGFALASMITTLTLLGVVLRPQEHASENHLALQRFITLRSQFESLSDEEVFQALDALQAETAHTGVLSLAYVAYRANLDTRGFNAGAAPAEFKVSERLSALLALAPLPGR